MATDDIKTFTYDVLSETYDPPPPNFKHPEISGDNRRDIPIETISGAESTHERLR